MDKDKVISAKIVKDGANANGLRLIGDPFIGYRFVPRGYAAESADNLLSDILGDDAAEWCAEYKDGEYTSTEWNAIGDS